MTTGPPSADSIRIFREKLLAWAAAHPRPLPWKGERDPYKIWLSEIILQQTRVEQGMPYYERFVSRFPTVRNLAAASEDEVLKLWEGLGYYTRARNLHAAAKHVADVLNGSFPDTYAGIRALKGVGDYTAAAVASFAFRLPYAVVDGNVFRVLARVFGIGTPTDSPAAKKEFGALAQALLDPKRPDEFNQAIMDFGATQCTPRQPKCATCPLQTACAAHQTGRIGQLPAKGKAATRKNRFFLYAVFNHRGDTFVRQRRGKDIWQNLWEFPGLELPAPPAGRAETTAVLQAHFFPDGLPAGAVFKGISEPVRQMLTHQNVAAAFCEIEWPDDAQPAVFQSFPFTDCRRLPRGELKKKVAFPRLIDWYLQKKNVTYSLF